MIARTARGQHLAPRNVRRPTTRHIYMNTSSPPPQLKGDGDHYVVTIPKDEATRRGLREGDFVSINVWRKQSRLKRAKPAGHVKHAYYAGQIDRWRPNPRFTATWLMKMLESITPPTAAAQRQHDEERAANQALLDNLNAVYNDGPDEDEQRLMAAMHRQASYVLHRHE